MTDYTDMLGIPIPGPSTKLRDLGDALRTAFAAFELELLNAGLPPVTNPQHVVAASAAARDAYWGVPATPAEVAALAAQGAQTIRTDTGWTEQYFAADNTVTPARAAGWRPVSGLLPSFQVDAVNGQAIASGGVTISGAWGAPRTNRHMRGWAGGVLTIEHAGEYEFTFTTGVGEAYSIAPVIALGGSAAGDKYVGEGTGSATVGGGRRFAAGDTIAFRIYCGAASNLLPARTTAVVRYVGP